MSPRQEPRSLKHLTLGSCKIFFENVIEFAVVNIVADHNDGDQLKSERFHRILETFLDQLKADFIEGLPSNMMESIVTQILDAIVECVERRKSVWKVEEDNKYMSKFTQTIYAITEFVNLIVLPSVVHLDLSNVVKMLRTKLFEYLVHFPQARILKLGSGSGGVSDVFQSKVTNALSFMDHLVHFSLNYDATDAMMAILQRNASETLKIIDIEHSFQITDAGVNDIVKCPHIVQLHLFHTSITPFGHAVILRKLPQLQVLVRGDFLADALEVLSHECLELDEEYPKLKLKEFWSSEQYFFHDTEQMKLVQEMCPQIQKMMFQFSEEHIEDFVILSQFRHLTELHNWGGEFYRNGFSELIQQIGSQLRILYLIHVDEIDLRALALISHGCTRLDTLGFYNCIFEPFQDETNPNQWNRPKIRPMLEVTKFALVSDCDPNYLVALVSRLLNIKTLITGTSTNVSDEMLGQVRAENQLQRLEELRVARSQGLTVSTVYSLIQDCPQLRLIRDIEYWTRVSEPEMWQLGDFIAKNNLDLDIGLKFPASMPYELGSLAATHFWSRQAGCLQDL